ncbi:MAG TPA: glycosyltransferase [Chthoniobacterales bacterium]|nr:glycosyltransferase [Chthoniobacterales bacterium]
MPATDAPRVGIFCPTFLKPEMLHVYRQVAGLNKVDPVVLAFKRENADRFPFETIRIVERSPMRWLRRIVDVQIREVPQQAYPSEVRSLKVNLAEGRCDLLHIYFGNNGLFWLPFLRAAQLPVVVSFHGADVHVNVNSRAAKRMFEEMFAACALVLTRSESLASPLREFGCSPAKIQIQRTGIPLDAFTYFARERPADDAWRLVQACRLVEKKGLESTLRAFASFAKQYPKSVLTIAGDGPLRVPLENLATGLQIKDRVQFTGFIPQKDLQTIYRQSHIFLHPSEQTADGNREGIPNSLLEAMATGLPCIATRHGGIPEAITNLKSGLLVEESYPVGIAAWLERLASDCLLRYSIGKQGAEAIREKFDLRMQIDKLEKIYLSVLKR